MGFVDRMLISLRLATPVDEDFLYQVYASTREDEMAIVPWTLEQKEAFVRMQFNAQRQSYRMQFPEATYEIILRDQVPIGRLILSRTDDRILLIDIALLPEYRHNGIGSTFIQDLQSESAKAGMPLRLYVETFNPALRLYERLGFLKMAENGIYYEMEWRA